MTPPATARSSRRSTSGSRPSSRPRPRRISGPSGPVRSGGAAVAVAIPAPGIALPRERKPRPDPTPRTRPGHKTARRPVQGAPGIALRAIDGFEGISSSAFVDRLIRGRLWIGLLAFALIGIVAMQLLVLKLNTGIGRTLGRVETLQRENAQLGIEDSMYSAEDRVAPLAAAEGMTLAPAGTVHFVVASKADVSRAAAALSTASQALSSESSDTTSSTSSGESAASPASSEVQASSDTSSQAESNAQAAGASESSGATGSGVAAAGSESSSASDTASSTPTDASTPSQTSSSPTGAQETGTSVAPSGSVAPSATQASGPGGGTQADTGE